MPARPTSTSIFTFPSTGVSMRIAQKENKRQYIDHLPVSTRLLQEILLQGSECIGEFGERYAIAKRTWLALHDRQIVPPRLRRGQTPGAHMSRGPSSAIPFGDYHTMIQSTKCRD